MNICEVLKEAAEKDKAFRRKKWAAATVLLSRCRKRHLVVLRRCADRHSKDDS